MLEPPSEEGYSVPLMVARKVVRQMPGAPLTMLARPHGPRLAAVVVKGLRTSGLRKSNCAPKASISILLY